MTIPAGTRLGPYEVLSPLGAGGMGEVYRARDTRLGREVAIKVLPPSFSRDPDRLRRFEQEARAAGVLNHPNITAVYDVGTYEGAPYVVQELLEGETLRALLAGSRLPLRKSADYALQIAHGLAAAHEKGIVHRDLKPENLFITKDGRVKILDFGLAKLTQSEAAQIPQTELPTVGTEPGIVLGTLGYMSPEQVKGRTADAQSDIFSFGTILYEMLSGNRAFHRDSAAETMSAILKEDPPDLSVMNQNVSPGLDRIVRHCLEKNPEQRFHSAHDLAFDLEALSGVSTPTSTVAPPRARPKTASAAIAVVGALAIAVGGYWIGRKPSSSPSRYEQLTFRNGTIYAARFAPDGRSVLYSAAWDGGPLEVWTKNPDSPDAVARNLPGANLLAVSRSGELAVALGGCQRAPLIQANLCGGTLARLPLTGGAPREVAENVIEAAWSPSGTDLVITRPEGDTYRLEYPVGKVLYQTPGYASDPRMSPKEDLIAFFDHPVRHDDRGSVAVVDLQGRKRTLSAGWESLHGLAWSPSGAEIWFTGTKAGTQRSLHSVSLSALERLVAAIPGGITLQDVSPSGRLLLTHDVERQGIMALVPGEARERELSWLDWSHGPILSDDGKTLLFDEESQALGGDYALCIRRTVGSPVVRLGDGTASALSPDGRWALPAPLEPAAPLLLLPTGAGERKVVKLPAGMAWDEGRFFPDGERLLLEARLAGHGNRLWVLPLQGGAPRPLTSEGVIAGFALSPDGRRAAARIDGALMLFPVEGGEPRPIPGAAENDTPISFGKDGRSLFLQGALELPRRVWRLEMETGRRTLWKELTPPDPTGVRFVTQVTVTPDGRSYAYIYLRWLADLFVADGLK